LRRMILVLVAATLMAAAMAVSAMPAMAKANPPSCEEGQSTATDNQPTGTERHAKHAIKEISCAFGLPPSS
jgi:Spy/CpxP family protein refolding chaperone